MIGDLLAAYVAADNRPISPGEREIIRFSTIDTFGCILVGAQNNVSVMCRDAVAESTPGNHSAFGSALQTSAEKAAFLNAVAAHALDLDDWEIPGNSHASAVLIPALIAAAEQPLSIEDFSRAYRAGFEVIARFGEAINFEHYNRGWHTTGTLACIGAAAAISHLWQLDRLTARNAICLAVSRVSGLFRQFGSQAKPLQAGFAAENAVAVCRLARAGITAQATVFEGPQGYLSLTGHDDSSRHRAAFARLGENPSALEHYGQVLKPHAMCGYTIRVIGCAQQIAAAGIEASDIESVVIELPDFHANILPFSQPTNQNEAMFSLPFAVAMGYFEGSVRLAHHDARAWEAPDIRQLINKCIVQPFKPARPTLNYDPDEPDTLTVTLKNGANHQFAEVYPLGAPQNPMSLQQVIEKFRQNASYFRALSEAEITQLTAWSSHDLVYLFNLLGTKQ